MDIDTYLTTPPPPPLSRPKPPLTHAEKEEQSLAYNRYEARKRLRMLLKAYYWYIFL